MTDPNARTLTAEKFASLWREPKDAYPFVKVEKRDAMIAVMRHRAECWIAEALGRPMVEIPQCDDIDELRAIYGACLHVTAADVRDWFKARERAEKKLERAARPKKQKKDNAA